MTKDKSIFIKNIYYMLSYAFTTLQQSDGDKIATEKFENVHNLFVAILSKGIGRQLKQGLYREYMHKWTNDERMMITCRNDGTRPVIFKIERIDIPETDEEREWLEKQNFSNSKDDAYTG